MKEKQMTRFLRRWSGNERVRESSSLSSSSYSLMEVVVAGGSPHTVLLA